MIYYIRFLWPEDNQFVRDIIIPSHLSFLDLHKAIQKALNFQSAEMSSFIITDEQWNKLSELPLADFEHPDAPSPMDIPLDSYLTDYQHFLYVFDYFSERALFCQVIKTEEDSDKITKPVLVKSEGKAPEQMKIDLDINPVDDFQDDFDDDIFDDNEFNDTGYFDEESDVF